MFVLCLPLASIAPAADLLSCTEGLADTYLVVSLSHAQAGA